MITMMGWVITMISMLIDVWARGETTQPNYSLVQFTAQNAVLPLCSSLCYTRYGDTSLNLEV